MIAMTGATGYVGRFVMAELQQQGMVVRALVRPNSERGGFAAPMSDLYVTHRDLVRLARRFAGRPGALPPSPSSPFSNPLVCRRLSELGVTLGGVPALEATVAELVRLAYDAGTGAGRAYQ